MKKRWLGIAVALLFVCQGIAAQETLSGTITKGREDERIAIAVPPFATAPGLEVIGHNMAAMVSYDLIFSGAFRVLRPAEYPPNFTGLSRDPVQTDFAAWRESKAEFLVHVYLYQEEDEYVADCLLFDLLSTQQVVGKRMRARIEWLRLIGHQFSEEIVRFLTGEPGIASSQYCFSGGQVGKKEIYIADYDGANLIQVTKHDSISILPKFSPDGRKIAYMSYKDRFPFLYIFNLDTGQSTPLSKNVGLNAAPAWSPDGRRLAVVLSKDANAEIYVMNPDGSAKNRLTHDRAVDSSPTFHPNGQQIAFVSERTGTPQIFVMDASGEDVRRLSYQGGRSYDPAWSPNGKQIAYVVERRGDGLEIYVMDADGKNARAVTASSGSNEAPSWSPDSRHIVFASTRSGRSELWTVNVETLETRCVPGLKIRSEGPDWGPRRK